MGNNKRQATSKTPSMLYIKTEPPRMSSRDTQIGVFDRFGVLCFGYFPIFSFRGAIFEWKIERNPREAEGLKTSTPDVRELLRSEEGYCRGWDLERVRDGSSCVS